MAERTIQVTEWMADFIKWVNDQGEETVRKIVRDHLKELKEESEKTKGSRIGEGYKWNDILTPNDGDEQWKGGGDCTLCRKFEYCMKSCRANKLLKKVSTPLLYQQYLEENPEAAIKNKNGLDTESLMKQLGVIQ